MLAASWHPTFSATSNASSSRPSPLTSMAHTTPSAKPRILPPASRHVVAASATAMRSTPGQRSGSAVVPPSRAATQCAGETPVRSVGCVGCASPLHAGSSTSNTAINDTREQLRYIVALLFGRGSFVRILAEGGIRGGRRVNRGLPQGAVVARPPLRSDDGLAKEI